VRLHCPTCTCGDPAPPVQVDVKAPFYPLVLLADGQAKADQYERRTERHEDDET
jgi:hypothetical protein